MAYTINDGINIRIALLLFIFILGVTPKVSCQDTFQSYDHSIFEELLNKYVDNNGLVDYENFSTERKKLNRYLNTLGKNPISKQAPQNEQLAYWINLYNAFTTELILQYYPLNSIKDIGDEIPLIYSSDAWDIEFININDTLYTLDKIEHDILAKQFDEPRIHFALVCAAKSCPKLRKEAYRGEELDIQLNNQAITFMSNASKNQITKSEIKVSEIFNWYRDEFGIDSDLISYLNLFSNSTISSDAKISFIPFDWSLNDIK